MDHEPESLDERLEPFGILLKILDRDSWRIRMGRKEPTIRLRPVGARPRDSIHAIPALEIELRMSPIIGRVVPATLKDRTNHRGRIAMQVNDAHIVPYEKILLHVRQVDVRLDDVPS